MHHEYFLPIWEGGGGGGEEEVTNKSSLSLGRTLAGIVCCFWGMFDTVRGSQIIKYVFTFLSENPKYLEYEKYVQRKSGNIKEHYMRKKNAFL